MSIRYKIPPGIKLTKNVPHPVLSMRQGGGVALDRYLLELWQSADGTELNDLINDCEFNGIPEVEVRAGLLCLAQSGLLARKGEVELKLEREPVEGDLVSIIIVSFNSRNWLSGCLSSVLDQSYSPFEVIIVDNASTDGSAEWIMDRYPELHLIVLDDSRSLAGAINRGIAEAEGNYYLLLNPDVELEPNVISLMVKAIQEDPNCAAVTAKLRLLWAPAFLNGLGNFVGGFSWGTDIALGHLDLGQFDHIKQVPSACFATTLISSHAWEFVGALDEGFLLYYEDSEWCYRARLFGYQVKVVTQEVVYHAFGGSSPSSSPMEVSKYRKVVYGRLRFITKLLSWKFWLRFILAYILEDFLSFLYTLIRGRFDGSKALLRGWTDFISDLSEISSHRKSIQERRIINDNELFQAQRWVPPTLIWQGFPILTRDLIRNRYLLLILSEKTYSFPEFPERSRLLFSSVFQKENYLRRSINILKAEGLNRFINRVWRYTQWRLMKV